MDAVALGTPAVDTDCMTPKKKGSRRGVSTPSGGGGSAALRFSPTFACGISNRSASSGSRSSVTVVLGNPDSETWPVTLCCIAGCTDY